MTYRVVTFPIQLGRPIDSLILGARMAVADILRTEGRAAVARANEAGVDAMTTGQRLVMTYMSATRASQFLRAYPGPVARWCFQTEQHSQQLSGEGYPAAPAMSIGGYDRNWITLMPGNNVLISAGGVRAAGMLATGPDETPIALHEVREVRLTRGVDLDGQPTWSCSVIMSNDVGNRDMVEDPAEPHPVMEPEDQ
jgi:hypothetical protein